MEWYLNILYSYTHVWFLKWIKKIEYKTYYFLIHILIFFIKKYGISLKFNIMGDFFGIIYDLVSNCYFFVNNIYYQKNNNY